MELEPLHPIQLKRFREMNFREKFAVSKSLFRMARRARLEAARKSHPGLSQAEYDTMVAKEFAGSRT